MALGVPAGCKCIVAWIPRWHAIDRGLRICRPVSNLSARLPRDALRSRTSPRPVGTDELGRCGAEHGAGGQYVGAALASHGRSHRFDPCHAHYPFVQVSAPHYRSSPATRTPAGGEQAAGAFSAARTRAWVSAGTWVSGGRAAVRVLPHGAPQRLSASSLTRPMAAEQGSGGRLTRAPGDVGVLAQSVEPLAHRVPRPVLFA
jgi:hypothetical protein